MVEKLSKAGVGYLEITFFLNKANVDLFYLLPLSELLDFGRKPVSIPLEEGEG